MRVRWGAGAGGVVGGKAGGAGEGVLRVGGGCCGGVPGWGALDQGGRGG